MRDGRILLIALMLLAACAGQAPPQSDEAAPNRRQLDSVVARSPLPGARAVDRALGVLDASNARNAALDSIR